MPSGRLGESKQLSSDFANVSFGSIGLEVVMAFLSLYVGVRLRNITGIRLLAQGQQPVTHRRVPISDVLLHAVTSTRVIRSSYGITTLSHAFFVKDIPIIDIKRQ